MLKRHLLSLVLLLCLLLPSPALAIKGVLDLVPGQIYDLNTALRKDSATVTLETGKEYIVQNIGTYTLRFADEATAPNVNSRDAFVIKPEKEFVFDVEAGLNNYLWLPGSRGSARVVVTEKRR